MGVCGSKEAVDSPSTPPRGNRLVSSSGNSSLPSSGEKTQDTLEPRKMSLPTVMENKELTDLTEVPHPHPKTKTHGKQHAKILLLGAGESGKSTILKQIKIIHQNGFTERDKQDYRPFIYQNIITSSQSVVKALYHFKLDGELKSVNKVELNQILNYEVSMDTELTLIDPSTIVIIKKLVQEPVVIKLINGHSSEFYLLDSAAYFFSSLERICQNDYIPNEMDILRTRRQTSGIFDTKFQMEDIDIHLYDVGGQRSERKKWIHCFDNVTAIMFCVALSEYDQTLLESSTSNRLEESLDLFDSVINSMWFRRTSIILCLNKIDVFIEKLPKSPLEDFFPDYVGGNDVGKAVKYILWRFKQLNRSNLNMVPYVTQATDTNNIKSAFAVVKETIVHNNLVDSGVITGSSTN